MSENSRCSAPSPEFLRRRQLVLFLDYRAVVLSVLNSTRLACVEDGQAGPSTPRSRQQR